jgi:signal transduction histidine kinase
LRPVISAPRFVGRAAAGFGLVTAITALTAIGSAFFAREEGAVRERILEAYADDLAHAFQAQLAAERMVAVGRGYFLAPEPELMERLHTVEADLDAALSALDQPRLSAGERDLLVRTRRSASVYRRLFDNIVTTAPPSELASRAAAFREELMPAREDLGARLEELTDRKRELQVEARQAASNMASRTFAFMVGLASLGVTLSLVLAWAFTRRLATIYRREQESAARATKEAAGKEELLGIVAHDLRNPLSAIAMKSALIRRGSSDVRMQEQGEAIAKLAMRMDAFIQTLLQAASIEAGRLSLSWKQCSVAEVLAATMETFASIAAQKSITLEEEQDGQGLAFWGDPERIVQVISNLVGNALKFTPEGGSVRIRAVESGFHTRFEVRDTGPGIASQHLPHVFDRFWKAEAGGHKGTGLGLYIAKGIVESHRGRIWVESRVGSGSAFMFELPIAQPPVTAPKEKSWSQPPLTVVTSASADQEVAQHPHS